jgi:hypothetical protein
MACSRESEVFKLQSFISWGFPWAVWREHKDEVSWLDKSSSWKVLEAILGNPETMEVCLD